MLERLTSKNHDEPSKILIPQHISLPKNGSFSYYNKHKTLSHIDEVLLKQTNGVQNTNYNTFTNSNSQLEQVKEPYAIKQQLVSTQNSNFYETRASQMTQNQNVVNNCAQRENRSLKKPPILPNDNNRTAHRSQQSQDNTQNAHKLNNDFTAQQFEQNYYTNGNNRSLPKNGSAQQFQKLSQHLMHKRSLTNIDQSMLLKSRNANQYDLPLPQQPQMVELVNHQQLSHQVEEYKQNQYFKFNNLQQDHSPYNQQISFNNTITSNNKKSINLVAPQSASNKIQNQMAFMKLKVKKKQKQTKHYSNGSSYVLDQSSFQHENFSQTPQMKSLFKIDPIQQHINKSPEERLKQKIKLKLESNTQQLTNNEQKYIIKQRIQQLIQLLVAIVFTTQQSKQKKKIVVKQKKYLNMISKLINKSPTQSLQNLQQYPEKDNIQSQNNQGTVINLSNIENTGLNSMAPITVSSFQQNSNVFQLKVASSSIKSKKSKKDIINFNTKNRLKQNLIEEQAEMTPIFKTSSKKNTPCKINSDFSSNNEQYRLGNIEDFSKFIDQNPTHQTTNQKSVQLKQDTSSPQFKKQIVECVTSMKNRKELQYTNRISDEKQSTERGTEGAETLKSYNQSREKQNLISINQSNPNSFNQTIGSSLVKQQKYSIFEASQTEQQLLIITNKTSNISATSGGATNFINNMNLPKLLRDSNLKNPLESSTTKSSCNFNQKSKRQNAQQIKEADSLEEKGSSSNSCNEIVDLNIKPILQSDLFNIIQISELISHSRQKTTLINPSTTDNFLNPGLSQYNHQFKRYIDNEESKTERSFKNLQELESQDYSNELLTQQSERNKETNNVNNLLIDNDSKVIDKKKLWLLDSLIFDKCLAEMQNENIKKEQILQENEAKTGTDLFSDTVIFDRDCSIISTPILRNIEAKKNVTQNNKLQESQYKYDQNKSFQRSNRESFIMNMSQELTKNYLVIEDQEMHKIENSYSFPSDNENNMDRSLDMEDEDQYTKLWSAHQSLIVAQLISSQKNTDFKNQISIEDKMNEFNNRFNMEKDKKVLLEPKFKLHELCNYIQPTYYDVIYFGNANSEDLGEPLLEENYVFDTNT